MIGDKDGWLIVVGKVFEACDLDRVVEEGSELCPYGVHSVLSTSTKFVKEHYKRIDSEHDKK